MSAMGFAPDLGTQAAALGMALLTGAALGIYYDLYRILRRVFAFGYAMIVAQDVLFWISGAVGVFFASVVVSGGRLRIFFVLAVFAGWGIYAATAGRVLMKVVDVILLLLRRLCAAVNRRIITPAASRLRVRMQPMIVRVREKIRRIVPNMRKKCKKTA